MTAESEALQDAAPSSIVDYAESLGITLLPWQRAYAEAVERGEQPVMQMSKQAGRTTLRKVINAWHEQAQDAAQQHAEQAEEHDRNYYVLSDSPDVRYAAEAAIALRQARSNNQPEGTA